MKLKPIFENVVVDGKVIVSVELSPNKFGRGERTNGKEPKYTR